MNSVFHAIKQNPGNRFLIQVWNKLKKVLNLKFNSWRSKSKIIKSNL